MSKSSAKTRIDKLIKRKISFTQKSLTRQAKKLGPNGIVREFMTSIEDARHKYIEDTLSNNYVVKLREDIESIAKKMFSKFARLDPNVSIKIVWHDENNVDKIKDLIVDGIHITWSDEYIKENKLSNKELYIDSMSLFLSDL